MLSDAVFTENDIIMLKNTSDAALREVTGRLLEQAKEALARADSLKLLGFGYFYTGDRAYFEKAREVMRRKVEHEEWVSDSYAPGKYGGYDIRTALETEYRTTEMAEGLALFGDLLEKEERDYFIAQTYQKGIRPILEDWVLPVSRLHALDTMGHNFWITITSAAGFASVVLRDYLPDGDACLESSLRAVKAWFDYPGNPLNSKPCALDRGGCYEGVTYFDFSMHKYLEFASAYRSLTGSRPFDDEQIVCDAARFILACWYPSDGVKDYYAGFGDCEFGGAMLHSPLHLVRYGVDLPALRYYLQNRHRNSADLLELALAWRYIYGLPASPPDVRSAFYEKLGWAIFHDGFKPNSVMLAVKCGDTWNHAHADCAHFNLYRGGVPELYDTMQADDYGSTVYHEYYVASEGHNVLLFNGHGQDYRDNYKNHAHLPGRLYNFTDDGWFRYVVADGTGPMSRYFRKHHRHFIWLNGFILVYDDVECYERGEVSFLLHAREPNCFHMLSPCSIEVKSGFSGGGDRVSEYKSFVTTTDSEGHAKFLGVMALDPSLPLSFDDIPGGWRVICGDTAVYVNHLADGKIMQRNCVNVMDGIVTDAELLAVFNGEYAAANCSIIRRGGCSILESLSRVTGIAGHVAVK